MDPPLSPHPTTTTTTTDSAASSPRHRIGDQPPPASGPSLRPKLRLMCSFGGHIIPRPHDKTLCYVGGETRMIVIDRNASLAELSTRISKTVLNNRPFTLKYQLPNEDLDSLISVTTDEDLDNMLDECDRVCAAKNSNRVRLFLFFNKPDSVVSMGALIGEAKSESWFVDALNSVGLARDEFLPRGLSDSAVDSLLNLDGDGNDGNGNGNDGNDGNGKSSMPNSPMVDNSSSFGSTNSTPSMANLPPIKTRVEGDGGVSVQAVGNVGGGCEGVNVNRVVSDDERSDQGVPVAMRRPPLPVQLGQPRVGVPYNLASPDSVASDGSMASASSFARQMFYQDQASAAPRDNRAPASPTQRTDASALSSQVHMQQVQVPRYVMQQQADQQQPQQQFVHTGPHYIAHPPPSGQMPMPSYYQVYAHPPSQQQQIHHPIDQQYPVYVMPMMQPPPYNMSAQSNMADPNTNVVAANRAMASPNPNLVTPSPVYKDGVPPMYPAKAPSPPIPEMASSVYTASATSTPQLVQIPSNQYQPQFVGYSQMQHPSQSISVASSAGGNYGYEYASTASAHDHGYYGQHQNTAFPANYQTMTAAAVMELSDASKQQPTEQQNRTSQP